MLLIDKIYILTGLLMFIGLYLTIKYTPRCIINTREMLTLRKKILNEPMHENETQILNNYETNGFRYSIGSNILYFSVFVHILTLLEIQGDNATIMHWLAILCSIPMYVTWYRHSRSCLKNMIYSKNVFQTSDEDTLDGINLYLKYLRGKKLDEDELKDYKMYRYSVNEVILVRYARIFGVILLLIIGIFDGLINVLFFALTG